jgi:hypothetical protein
MIKNQYDMTGVDQGKGFLGWISISGIDYNSVTDLFYLVDAGYDCIIKCSWDMNTWEVMDGMFSDPKRVHYDSSFGYLYITDSNSVVKTKMVKEHSLTISGLLDQTEYSLSASGRDQYGNQATSDTQSFTTKEDSRPPKIDNIKLETSISGMGSDSKAQIIVSWQTDEPSTSQVEYGLGVGGDTYQLKTTEDSSLATSHTVIISDLDPSRSYHLSPLSKDSADNQAHGTDHVVITGIAQQSALDIIINKLKETFGFLGKIKELF